MLVRTGSLSKRSEHSLNRRRNLDDCPHIIDLLETAMLQIVVGPISLRSQVPQQRAGLTGFRRAAILQTQHDELMTGGIRRNRDAYFREKLSRQMKRCIIGTADCRSPGNFISVLCSEKSGELKKLGALHHGCQSTDESSWSPGRAA
jgi:hypothetical protein